jgi:hypothetical protein
MTGLNKKQHLYIICWLVAAAIGFYCTIEMIMSLPPYSEERIQIAMWIFPCAGLIGMIIAHTLDWFE